MGSDDKCTSMIFLSYSNCKLLKDRFDIPDGNITRENCLSVVSHYNSTYPSEVEQLGLKTCDLQALLDKVITAETQARIPSMVQNSCIAMA